MKNKNHILKLFSSAVLLTAPLFSAIAFGATTGQLRGKIVPLNNANIDSVMIQVIGATQTDSFVYYTIPNPDGTFDFDGKLPVGSTVQLYFWDQKGVLEHTVLTAYVSPNDLKFTDTYTVFMGDHEFTQTIAQLNNTTHDMTKAGLCGDIRLFHRFDKQKLTISVYDRFLKSKVPILTQNVDDSNQFCVFNLVSTSGSDVYDFVVQVEDQTKSFTFYIPPTTFIHNVELDSTAVLYRPIAPFIWKDTLISLEDRFWKKLHSLNLATSDDYSFVSYNSSNIDENLFYFPLGNEFLEVSYYLDGESANHFFTLIPRTKVFREKHNPLDLPILIQSVYVDYNHPYPLKIVSEFDLMELNSNLYYQTWNEKFGSVFLNLDLISFGTVNNANEIKVSLRNSAGQEVGIFEQLIVTQKNSLVGMFLNLLPGRYQLFVQDLKGNLLWTYEVRSYQNRVQIITNEFNLSKNILPEFEDEDENDLNTNDSLNDITHQNEFLVDNFYEISLQSKTLDELKKEQNIIQNNSVYKHNTQELCMRRDPKNFLEILSSL